MKYIHIVFNGEVTDPKKMQFFRQYKNGEPVFSDNPFDCIAFDYSDTAEGIADDMTRRTGREWHVMQGVEHDNGDRQFAFEAEEFEKYKAQIEADSIHNEMEATRNLLKSILNKEGEEK